MLFNSPHWIWELEIGEIVEPVKPIASLVNHYVPKGKTVYTSADNLRPSLNFYSERQVIPQTNAELKKSWQHNSEAYLLIDSTTFEQLNLPQDAIAQHLKNQSHNWIILSKNLD